MAKKKSLTPVLAKCRTGIRGLDEITNGGLPRGRPTLVCGQAGTGKTLLAMEFLVHGALEEGEHGVFLSFDESAADLGVNVASIGFDIPRLLARRRLVIDQVLLERSQILETGEYDLEGLFLRIDAAVREVRAKRIVLDSLETVLDCYSNTALVRSEVQRLFRWMKEKGLTAVVTAEPGAGTLTRYGIEEYVSDCVIVLDQKLDEQIGTRHLRIAKYRGTAHGTNEYPFLVDERGISVVPITSLGLQHDVSTGRVSTGVAELDRMLGGKGYFRGSTAMVSGTAGTGKTSLAAHFVDAACARGERALFLAFEEAAGQVVRNMRSVGVDLGRWRKSALLRFHSSRPSAYGLELHLAAIHREIEEFRPHVVVVDPITDFEVVGRPHEVKAMLTRLVDSLKSRRITGFFTSLTTAGAAVEQSESGISSLIDTWFLLRNLEQGGERNRALYVLKSRGMAHSNQVREFLLTERGIRLVDVFVGPEGIATGRRRVVEQRRQAMEERIRAMRAQFEAETQAREARAARSSP